MPGHNMVSHVSNIMGFENQLHTVRSIRTVSLRAHQFLLLMPVSFFWPLHAAEETWSSSVFTAGNLHHGVMAARRKSPKRGFISQRKMTTVLYSIISNLKLIWESIRESTKDRTYKQNWWWQWDQFLPDSFFLFILNSFNDSCVSVVLTLTHI